MGGERPVPYTGSSKHDRIDDMKKICTKCLKKKFETEFSYRKRSKDKRHSWCRKCKGTYEAILYKHNPKRRMDISMNNKRTMKKHRELLNAIKIKAGCKDCGNKNPIVLDFDHTENNKLYTIARMMNGLSWDRIQVEIDKCEVVCANCHRIRTFSRRLSS